MNGFVMANTLTFKCNGLCDVFCFDVLLLVDNEHIPIFLEFPAIFVNPLLDLIFYKHQNNTSSNTVYIKADTLQYSFHLSKEKKHFLFG